MRGVSCVAVHRDLSVWLCRRLRCVRAGALRKRSPRRLLFGVERLEARQVLSSMDFLAAQRCRKAKRRLLRFRISP